MPDVKVCSSLQGGRQILGQYPKTNVIPGDAGNATFEFITKEHKLSVAVQNKVLGTHNIAN